jgi:hypothetical protein
MPRPISDRCTRAPRARGPLARRRGRRWSLILNCPIETRRDGARFTLPAAWGRDLSPPPSP